MTDINIEIEKDYRFRLLFSSAVIVCLTFAMFLGMKLETVHNTIILPVSPFENGEILQGVASVCVYDFTAFWLLALSLTRALRVGVSCSVFFLRGIVMGNALRVFFENSVPRVAVFILFSYIAVTFLLLLYDAFLNLTEKRSIFLRVMSCFALTGAAAAIRVLPMLLL